MLLNRAIADVTGISNEEMLGKRDADLFAEDAAALSNARDPGDADARRARRHGRATGPDPAKGTRIMHVQKEPILGDDGEPAFVLGISEDITDPRAAEPALREAMEAADRAK